MLDIWLPMLGNTDNQGIQEISVETNATVDTSGKLGKCYSFNGVTSYLTITNDDAESLSSFSLTFWVCDKGGINDSILLSFGNVKIVRTSSRYLQIGSYISETCLIPNNQWCHISIIKNENYLHLYKDGCLIEIIESDLVVLPDRIVFGIDEDEIFNNYYGLLNDFRLYTDCISGKEVNILSKGLILHLPLSVPGNRNLLQISDLVNNNLQNYNVSFNKSQFTRQNNIGDIIFPGRLFEVNHEYTISFKFQKTNGTLNNIIIHGQAFNVSSFYLDGRLCSFANVYELTNNIDVHSVIITFQYIGSGDNPDLHVILNNATNDLISAILFNIKLENGRECTPWCPHELDGIYDDMGYDEQIIYDTSGYGNNCISSGGYTPYNFADELEDLFLDENLDYIVSSDDFSDSTLQWVSKSPRYSGCYAFNGVEQRVYGNLSIGNVYTVSCWVYIPEVSNSRSYIISLNTDSGLSDCQFAISITSTKFEVACGGNNEESSISYEINKWYHLALTCDGNTARFYINGEPDSSFTAGNTTGNNFNVAARSDDSLNSEADDFFKGNICDVRIYSTCLNNSDIQALYSAPISLSSSQSLYIQGDFIEL